MRFFVIIAVPFTDWPCQTSTFVAHKKRNTKAMQEIAVGNDNTKGARVLARIIASVN